MKNKMKWMLAIGLLSCSMVMAQQQSDILSVSASANADNAALAFDKNVKTMWTLPSQALKTEQWLMFTIQQPGDVCELDLQMQGVNRNELKEVLDIFVTYDPMNLGTPVNYRIEGNDKQMKVKFTPKYGAHVKLNFKPGKLDKPFSLKEISVLVAEKVLTDSKGKVTDRRYMDASLPVEERVESLLAVMTPEDKMELMDGVFPVFLIYMYRLSQKWKPYMVSRMEAERLFSRRL